MIVDYNSFLFRNGTDLGIAFDNVPCGKGIAYFPAISISQNERVQVNFGAIPLRHPTENYLPIDDKPRLLIEQSIFLFNVLEQIVHLGNRTRLNGSNKTTNTFKVTETFYLNMSLKQMLSVYF